MATPDDFSCPIASWGWPYLLYIGKKATRQIAAIMPKSTYLLLLVLSNILPVPIPHWTRFFNKAPIYHCCKLPNKRMDKKHWLYSSNEKHNLVSITGGSEVMAEQSTVKATGYSGKRNSLKRSLFFN